MELNDIEQKIEKELKEAMEKGPTFGDSLFQIQAFNIGKHETDSRAYRQILLELDKKFTVLKKARIHRRRTYAKLGLLHEKIEQQTNHYEKELLQCDLEEIEIDLAREDKLIKDAILECNMLYEAFKKLPKITREEFEAKEGEYWGKRLVRDAQREMLQFGSVSSGTSQSLQSIGYNPYTVQTELKCLQAVEQKKALETLASTPKEIK